MKNCPLCLARHHENQLLCENEHAYCLLNHEPIKKGHLMILPKTHKAKLDELTAEEAGAVLKLVEQTREALVKRYNKDPIILLHTGKHASQGQHLHFHITPSEGGMRDLFTSFEHTPFRVKKTEEELAALKEELRGLLF